MQSRFGGTDAIITTPDKYSWKPYLGQKIY